MRWVLLATAESVEEAQAEVDYLRSRNILGRVAGEVPYVSVEVRADDLERSKALFAARSSVRSGRLEERSNTAARRAQRFAAWIGVGAILLLLLALIAFVVWTFAGSLGAAAVVVFLVATAIGVAGPRSSTSISKLESSSMKWFLHGDPDRRQPFQRRRRKFRR